MPAAPFKTARDVMDRLAEADLAARLGGAGRDAASNIGDLGDGAGRVGESVRAAAETAGDAAREAASQAAATLGDVGREAARTSRGVLEWLGDAISGLARNRTAALGMAGAAVPASRQLAEEAAIRLGLKKREESHWGLFFLGIVLGALAGAAVALLTAPKPGREMRDELASRAREAGDWVPVFSKPGEQQNAATRGSPTGTTGTAGRSAGRSSTPRSRGTSQAGGSGSSSASASGTATGSSSTGSGTGPSDMEPTTGADMTDMGRGYSGSSS